MEDETALHWAIENDTVENVQLLLQHGASVNDHFRTSKTTALHIAANGGCLEVGTSCKQLYIAAGRDRAI